MAPSAGLFAAIGIEAQALQSERGVFEFKVQSSMFKVRNAGSAVGETEADDHWDGITSTLQ